MRIRFVTRDQLQVLQASRMEKHTIPDGTIPLYGLSPSAVSKQWGLNLSRQSIPYPITFSQLLFCTGIHRGDENENSVNVTILDTGSEKEKAEIYFLDTFSIAVNVRWIAFGV